jgi:hypothetical protein
MNRIFQFVLAAAIAVAGPLAAQPRKGGVSARPKPAPARNWKAVEQFNRMSPEARRRMIENLPPERKKQLEDRLQEYNQLSPEERGRLRDRLDEFRQLPQERQEALRRMFRRLNTLPVDRREPVREEFAALRVLPESERRARMNSDEFRNRYTQAERQLLQDLSRALR